MLKRIFINERVIMPAVLINGLIIFLLSFPTYYGNTSLLLLDDLFILFFAMEAIVKIAILKPKVYFADNWNVFDFILVLMSLPALMSSFMHIPMFVNFIMIFRLLRLFRLIRLIQFVPNMAHLIAGMGRAFRASLLVLIVLLFLNLILAVMSCHLFKEAAPEYFNNPLISAYTIFQMFTIEGWNEIPPMISEFYGNDVIEGLIRLYFVLIVLIGGVFGMSLANAIFVDEMTIDNNLELEKKIDQLQEEIKELKYLIVQQNERSND
ncbi:MAG: ion transporter [Bacteroidota bacterium]